MRCRTRNARALRCMPDEWLLSLLVLTSIRVLDSTGFGLDSAIGDRSPVVSFQPSARASEHHLGGSPAGNSLAGCEGGAPSLQPARRRRYLMAAYGAGFELTV